MKNDVLDSEDVLVVHLAYADDSKNEEEFQQVKDKCPFHGVKGNVVTIDEKLKITVVCNPNSIPMENQFEGFPEDRFALCCPNCGSRLIDGKCPKCG